MDIQYVEATTDSVWTYVRRSLDDGMQGWRLPRETVSIRAAEYNLDPDDPRVLDIVAFETFQSDPIGFIPPLFTEKHVESALEIVWDRIEGTKAEHQHPAGLTLIGTIHDKTIETTTGLIDLDSQQFAVARTIFPRIREHVATIRDYHREQLSGVKSAPPDLAASLAAQARRLRR